MIPIRQTGVLPWASFRFHLAMDTLAVGYRLGDRTLPSGLSPYRDRPCGAHYRKRAGALDEHPARSGVSFRAGGDQRSAAAFVPVMRPEV